MMIIKSDVPKLKMNKQKNEQRKRMKQDEKNQLA